MERHQSLPYTREPGENEHSRHRMPFQPLTLRAESGEVACRYYALPGARGAAVWVGTTSDWDTPARALYPRLCESLREDGIASLRIRLERPNDPLRCVADIRAGTHYLAGQGVRRLALIGHGRGGVAVIQAAGELRAARAVVALAPDGDGAGAIERLGPRCSLLLLQGDADPVVAWSAAALLYELAREPKDFVLYRGAGHTLDEVADAARNTVRDWVVGELGP